MQNKCFAAIAVLMLFSCTNRGSKSAITTNKADSQTVSKENHIESNQTEPKNISASGLTDTSGGRSHFPAGDEIRSHIALDFASATETGDTSKITVVNKICAISVIPDTSWLSEQQNSMDDGDWNTIAGDEDYYESIASDTLEKIGIPTIFVSRKKQFIRFIKANGQSITLDFQKMKDAWGLILFNRIDDPVLWNSTDIGEEIKEIYGK